MRGRNRFAGFFAGSYEPLGFVSRGKWSPLKSATGAIYGDCVSIETLCACGDPYESRTRVCGVRGRRLDHLTNGPSSSRTALSSRPACAARSPATSLLLFPRDSLRWIRSGYGDTIALPDCPQVIMRRFGSSSSFRPVGRRGYRTRRVRI
jgi:hypothetical protein